MPSPFPGMDPYLEAPGLWESVHHTLIVHIAAALNANLPPEYVAVVEDWLYVIPPQNRIKPDVLVGEVSAASPPGSLAVIERPAVDGDEPWIVESLDDRPRHLFVNIVRIADESQVIATLEVLSHANKTPGKDRDAYRRLLASIYESATHLIEVDLLRAGSHTVAVPIERLDEKPYDYVTCLHRGNTGARFELWPVSLLQRLPRIAIPLENDLPTVLLDLQACLAQTYETGAYARRIDYRQGPTPPLNEPSNAWADALLHAHGLR